MREWRLADPRWGCWGLESDVVFPYAEFRPGQRELAEEVAEAVRKGELLVVNAPTGFGKTAAVVYGLLLGGAERVLWGVRTVNEIDPVLRELKAFGMPFTFLFSARRTCPLLRTDEGVANEEFWVACKIARLRGECPYYARVEDAGEDEIWEYVKGHVSHHGIVVARDLARFLGLCPFFALRKLLATARVAVVTYPYIFRDDIRETVLDPYRLEDFVLVVDEAHSLLTAHQLAEREIRLRDVKEAADEAQAFGYTDVAKALNALEARLASYRKLRAARRVKKDALLGDLVDIADVIYDVAEEVTGRRLIEALSSQGAFRAPLVRVAKWLQYAVKSEVEVFLEPGEDGLHLKAMPVDPSVVAGPPLSSAKAVILISGTMPPSEFIEDVLGVTRPRRVFEASLVSRSAPRRFAVFVARDVTSKYTERAPAMYRRIAEYIALVARRISGVKLAVYPSYEFMREVVSRMPVDIDQIVESPRTSLADVREEISKRGGELLVNAVAGGKLVEGVEFTDYEGRSLLKAVLIAGVPYPQLDAYTEAFLGSLAGKVGLSKAKYYVYEVQAYVRVAQALGRAIRGPSDTAIYGLLDYRFLYARLRRLLRLKYDAVVSSPEELAGILNGMAARLGLLLKPSL